jgi:hypothetical protein
MRSPKRRFCVKVAIKDFNVEMEVKTAGVELSITNPQDVHLGDLIVTKTRLIWCQGQTRRANGKEIWWEDFIAYMNGRP